MKNKEWLIYTYRHRRAFAYCVDKLVKEPELRKEMQRRARLHDVDKMLMYLFLDLKTAQRLHIETQPHHLENDLPRTYEDYMETVIDYECAPYTKPDKPLNAYDFVNLLVDKKILDGKRGEILHGIMRDLAIDRSGTVDEDAEGRALIENLGEVTEEMLYEEILRYVDGERDNVLALTLKTLRESQGDSAGDTGMWRGIEMGIGKKEDI